jgi:hypothetical protein
MDIDKLKEFANTIKHCGDYGILWVNKDSKSVLWVAGDGDFTPEEVEAGLCTSYEDIKIGLSVEGVDHVIIEAESGPDEDDGWECLGSFGIDNWDEVKKYYEEIHRLP